MRTKKYLLIFFSFICCGCVYHNKDEMLENCGWRITYNKPVRSIIASHCAVSGCHVSGFQPGDYTTYSGIKEKVDNGKFKLRVLDLKIMPPYSKPKLDDDELQILKCWMEQGALEN